MLAGYLSREALRAIDTLRYPTIAYEAAKDHLEGTYGGKRQHIAIFFEDLVQFRQMRFCNEKDLEQLVDLSEIAIINLNETEQNHEFSNGSLFAKLQQILPQSMLVL